MLQYQQLITTFDVKCFTNVLQYNDMATLKAVVLKHQIRDDGTWNIKIRVTHNRKSAYIPTEHYIGSKQISKDCKKIKDNFILAQLDFELARLRLEISKFGSKIYLYSAKELADKLSTTRTTTKNEIDFFEFTTFKVNELKAQGRKVSASAYDSCANNLEKYIKRGSLDFKEITVKFLKGYETHLRSREDMGSRGLQSNLASIRALFNFAREIHNDDDLEEIKIPNYPFARYKIPKADAPQKRSLEIQVIRAIKEFSAFESNSRTELARDVFMLSFCLCGMNSADLYHLDNHKDGRITYNRTKTKDRRDDKAQISIKVESELLPLFDKYKDITGVKTFNFHTRYADHKGFNSALNKGLKVIGKGIDIENLEFYAARHSWATIARNDCNISKDDISQALNHTDPDKRITDKYIRQDWSRIDNANQKVLKFLNRIKK